MLNKEQTKQKIKELGWWYMHFKFPNGVKTGTDKDPGYDAENRWSADSRLRSFCPSLRSARISLL